MFSALNYLLTTMEAYGRLYSKRAATDYSCCETREPTRRWFVCIILIIYYYPTDYQRDDFWKLSSFWGQNYCSLLSLLLILFVLDTLVEFSKLFRSNK